MGLFISSTSEVDKAALQAYALVKLKELGQRALGLMNEGSGLTFWPKLHVEIQNTTKGDAKEKMRRVEEQLKRLPLYIETWVKTAVDTPQRFDFFVMAKAHEISSGDKDRDYFWALQIRHDQIVALIRVLEMLLGHMEDWVKNPVKKMLNEPVFRGLMDYSIEDQVFLEAEKVHKEREKLTKRRFLHE